MLECQAQLTLNKNLKWLSVRYNTRINIWDEDYCMEKFWDASISLDYRFKGIWIRSDL